MNATAPTRKHNGILYATPPNCPRDPALYLTLVLMTILKDQDRSHVIDADGKPGPFCGGVIDRETGEVWGVDERRKTKTPIDLAVIDKLVKLKWLNDEAGHNLLEVTKLGRHWLGKFVALNRGK